MEKVTYGAPRYMDWVAQIKVGSATLRVHFTGGALTVYGVTPAEYTTTDPFIQKAIEMSHYFKEGRITLVKRDTIITATKQPKVVNIQKSQTDKKTAVIVDDVNTEEKKDHSINVSDEVAEAHGYGVTGDEVAELIPVEVSCLPDAQDYLQLNYNIPSYKVRSNVAAQRAAAEHGIVFVGGKFTPLDSTVEESGEENCVEE